MRFYFRWKVRGLFGRVVADHTVTIEAPSLLEAWVKFEEQYPAAPRQVSAYLEEAGLVSERK